MLGRYLVALVFCVGMVGAGCNTATLTNAPPPGPSDPSAIDAIDGGSAEDAEASESTEADAGPDAGDPLHPEDSPCPAPRRVTTADVPAGYLPPVTVAIDHLVDGDSHDFDFPNATGQGVRMLYINTEESGGPDVTPFGIETKRVVHGWMRAAKEIQVAVRESSPGSGEPDADTYDRWLALVFLDGELLQRRIVREGWSAYYTQFGCAPEPVHSALLLAEAEAHHAQRGIWSTASGHNDYEDVFKTWIGGRTCRPNPFKGQPYCK